MREEAADIFIEKIGYRFALFIKDQQGVVSGIELPEQRVYQLMPGTFLDLQVVVVDQEHGVGCGNCQVLTICRLHSGEYFAVEAQGLRGEGGGEEERYYQ